MVSVPVVCSPVTFLGGTVPCELSLPPRLTRPRDNVLPFGSFLEDCPKMGVERGVV